MPIAPGDERCVVLEPGELKVLLCEPVERLEIAEPDRPAAVRNPWPCLEVRRQERHAEPAPVRGRPAEDPDAEILQPPGVDSAHVPGIEVPILGLDLEAA
jgi:hypothetical protein